MKKTLYVLVFVLLLISCEEDVPDDFSYSLFRNSSGDVVSDRDFVVCVKKEADKDFIILNLSDIHFTDFDDSEVISDIVDSLVEYKKPDLITITGDLTDLGTKKGFINLCEYLDSLGIPWAPVFGNHDPEGLTYTLKQQSEKLLGYSYCLYREGPELGYTNEPVRLMTGVPKLGNCIINLIEDDGQDFALVISLYMIISTAGSCVFTARVYRLLCG